MAAALAANALVASAGAEAAVAAAPAAVGGTRCHHRSLPWPLPPSR